LFNVVEHQFTIPRIAAFLKEEGLSFLGFELNEMIREQFQRQYPGPDDLTNLDLWDTFEADNPETFIEMYRFSVCRS